MIFGVPKSIPKETHLFPSLEKNGGMIKASNNDQASKLEIHLICICVCIRMVGKGGGSGQIDVIYIFVEDESLISRD